MGGFNFCKEWKYGFIKVINQVEASGLKKACFVLENSLMTMHFSRNGEKLRLPILYFTFFLLPCVIYYLDIYWWERELLVKNLTSDMVDVGFHIFFCLIFALHSKTTMKMWDLRFFQEIHGWFKVYTSTILLCRCLPAI